DGWCSRTYPSCSNWIVDVRWPTWCTSSNVADSTGRTASSTLGRLDCPNDGDACCWLLLGMLIQVRSSSGKTLESGSLRTMVVARAGSTGLKDFGGSAGLLTACQPSKAARRSASRRPRQSGGGRAGRSSSRRSKMLNACKDSNLAGLHRPSTLTALREPKDG